MSLLEGLISPQGKDDWKFGLWSFNDINTRFFARHSILLFSSKFSEMCLAFILIAFSSHFMDFR